MMGRPRRVLFLICLLVAALLPAHSSVADGLTTRFLRYTIDRSDVPDWVTRRELTLRINIGSGAEALWAWGDGQPLAVFHDLQMGTATVTTSAAELVLAIQGGDLAAEGLGDYAIAPLKSDKLWAYSLTFDDGRLSVYQYAYPELRRYRYRAGVAVIGYWLDDSTGEDALESGYCSRQELLQLIDNGWGIFNHSYSHFDAPSDITFEDAQRCQVLIEDRLNGYQATVFTAPYVNPLWKPVIDENMEELGLYLLQLRSEEGDSFVIIRDDPISLESEAYPLGRRDIKRWQAPNLFDQAHAYAMADTPQHVWLSLHGHDVGYEQDQDWCAVADSSSYLYHTYGEGGTDEVWMAPADEVFDYLVTRSYATVSVEEADPRELGPELKPPTTISYQQGLDDYSWRDAYIYEAAPNTNYGSPSSLVVRVGEEERMSVLLKADLVAPDEEAVVEHATLSLYAISHSNEGAIDLGVYPLLREWDSEAATWNCALDDGDWNSPGALGIGSDRAVQSVGGAHVQGDSSSNLRWYTFDVTEAVSAWLSGAQSHHGLLIEGEGSVNKSTSFAGSTYWDASKHPKLTIRWRWLAPEPTVAPSPTPTATSFPVRIYLPMIMGS